MFCLLLLREMIGLLLLVSLPAVFSLCGECNYSSPIFKCQGIGQDDLLLKLFRKKDVMFNLHEIFIEDSDFSSIRPFVDFSYDLSPAEVQIKYLTIQRSKVDAVSSDTFGVFKDLNKLNLRQNDITNLAWLTGLSYTNYFNLDLSYNKISELDFNSLKQMSSIWLNNNEISIVKPASDYISFDFVDLRYNKLVTFSEFEYNINIQYLDLSYNYLQMLSLQNKKKLLKIEGHENSNILYIGTSYFYSVYNFYSSFIPNNSLDIGNIFKFNCIDTDFLVLDSNKTPNIRSHIFDFSNNNLSNIPQNYFQYVQASVLNLSFNNFLVLSNKVFGANSAITTIDLSFSKIKKISNTFFINCCSSSSSYYSVFVNLSGNALEEIDGICTRIPQLKHLDLSSNRITNISQISLLNCTYLSFFNISNNFISHIPPDTFQGQVFIKTIDISENNLLFIYESTFSNIKRVLKNIFLRKNNILTLGSSTFDDFDYLQNIDLSDNKIRKIEQYAFSNLKSIDIINLSNNAIEVLESYTYYNISVKYINLQRNPIHNIKPKAFSNLKFVQSLNIRNLLVKKIDTISQKAFYNLQNLRYLDLSDLGISRIEPYAFSNINCLIEVNLKNNNIQGIDKYIFHMVNIGTLLLNSISNPIVFDNTVRINKMIIQLTGIVGERFISSVFLKNLTIEDSQIELLKDNCFVNLPLLKSLKLINTTIDDTEDNIFNGLTSLTYLDASQIFQNKMSLKEYTFKDMRNLEVLIISNSALNTIENNTFTGLSKLKKLHLQGNKLTVVNLTAITNGLPDLLTLNLSSSSIKNVHTSKLGSPNNVKYLDLSKNFIEKLDTQTFRLFQNLVELHLHSNLLSVIEYQTFFCTKNIKTLRLDNNKISTVPIGGFAGLENLRFLNISDNVNLFYYSFELSFQTLKKLEILYIDNTYSRLLLDFKNFTKSFPYVKKIGINDNPFNCENLLNTLEYLNSNGIDYTPYNPKFDRNNFNGVTCIL
uniref:Chaoptin-like n=1 Tax=Diabrotica virgifera virgifera TaxID=50390 RepID=A0A6P7GID9_DIAVI